MNKAYKSEEIIFTKTYSLVSEIKKKLANRRAVVLIDEGVERIYPEVYEGFEKILLPESEKAKTLENYSRTIEILGEKNADRSTVIIAAGGGATADFAGFVASTYKRGLPLIMVPTTIIGMCDAAIGGKNALDTSNSKNEIGTFYSPEAVIIDIDFIKTLSDRQFRSGLGEILKYAIGFDPEMLKTLKSLDSHDFAGEANLHIFEKIIGRSVEIKMDIVKRDFLDSHLRHSLNFGHTIAHGIEYASGYKISHGEAVATGVYNMVHHAFNEGRLDVSKLALIYDVYEHLGMTPNQQSIPEFSKVADAMKSDKKMSGRNLVFAKLKDLGEIELVRMPLDYFTSQVDYSPSRVDLNLQAYEDIVIELPTSKSYTHRYLILAAISGGGLVRKVTLSDDIKATISALKTISKVSFEIEFSSNDSYDIRVIPSREGYTTAASFSPDTAKDFEGGYPIIVDCGDSGSTARFTMPLVGLTESGHKGVHKFIGGESLTTRPMQEIIDVFESQGMLKGAATGHLPIEIEGRLRPGMYQIAGDVSSQYLSGLLMALPLMGGRSIVQLTTKLESAPYVDITLDAISKFGGNVTAENGVYKSDGSGYQGADADLEPELDYSQAAFWLVYEALRIKRIAPLPKILIPGLNPDSAQADKEILKFLDCSISRDGEFSFNPEPAPMYANLKQTTASYNIADCPDLLPILAVYLTLNKKGGVIMGADRNRHKESNRIASIVTELRGRGADIEIERQTAGLTINIRPSKLSGGRAFSHDDHRIAMALMIAGFFTENAEELKVIGTRSISKSYPRFITEISKIQEAVCRLASEK